MQKTILVTGATDGIGLETAKMLASKKHYVLLHGRNSTKLEQTKKILSELSGAEKIEIYVADLSNIKEVESLAKSLSEKHGQLNALINNAGVYTMSNPMAGEGLDIRFLVNTIAPYLLTKRLLPILGKSGRVINVSSAAQSSVDPKAFNEQIRFSDGDAYAQSKLALTMWSRHMGVSRKNNGPVVVSVNPKSMLGSKMVREAYGVDGADLRLGADILVRAALSEEFAGATGKYFDNDIEEFTTPHPDALNAKKCEEIVNAIETVIS